MPSPPLARLLRNSSAGFQTDSASADGSPVPSSTEGSPLQSHRRIRPSWRPNTRGATQTHTQRHGLYPGDQIGSHVTRYRLLRSLRSLLEKKVSSGDCRSERLPRPDGRAPLTSKQDRSSPYALSVTLIWTGRQFANRGRALCPHSCYLFSASQTGSTDSATRSFRKQLPPIFAGIRDAPVGRVHCHAADPKGRLDLVEMQSSRFHYILR